MLRTPARPAFVAWLAIAVATTACGGAAASPDASTPTAVSSASQAPAGSSDAADPKPGTALSACELVTAADIATVLEDLSGEPVEVAEGEFRESPSVLDPAASECRYTGDWGGVIVDLTPTDGANLYDAAVGAYDDAELLDLGDGAFWSASNNRGFFWKGSVNVMLQISFLAMEADRGEAVRAIGEAALAKL